MSGVSLVSAARVQLDVPAPTREAAVQAAAELLRDDERLGAWEEFRTSIGERQVVDVEGCGGGVVLAHGRGPSVKELALSALRWTAPDGPRLVFVFAIPGTMAEEYLRKVGALARVCREPAKLAALRAAATPEEFAARLAGWIG